MKTKTLTISAIAAAIVAIILTLGAYIEFIDLICVVFASLFVILPIYYKSYLGCFLTYLAGGVLAFLFSQFNILSLVFLPYFGFFGIYPIIMCLSYDKNFNKIVFTVLGCLWCVLVVYGSYFYYIFVMKNVLEGLPKIITDNIYFVVGILGVLSYFVFDRFIFSARILINRYMSKIIK